MKDLNQSYDDGLLNEGKTYTVGTNDGKVFNRVVYKGTKSFGGKSMMCFETEQGSQVSVNPSYNSFTIEEGSQYPQPEDFDNLITNKEKIENG